MKGKKVAWNLNVLTLQGSIRVFLRKKGNQAIMNITSITYFKAEGFLGSFS